MAERNDKGQFVKGETGNPKGRPAKEREGRYYEILMSTVTFEVWAEIVKKAAEQARKGDQAARKWLADYLVGPPVNRTELTGADGGAVNLNVIYTNKAKVEDGDKL